MRNFQNLFFKNEKEFQLFLSASRQKKQRYLYLGNILVIRCRHC